MRSNLPSRLFLGAAMAALFTAAPVLARGRGPGPQPTAPAPAMKPNRPPVRSQVRPPQSKPGPNQDSRLQQWMEQHSSQSLVEQQRALENEPGFHDLPAQTQQRYRDRLAQLNNMTPQQRNQILERNQILASRTPQQREQFRNGMQEYNALPQNRKLLFKRAFRDLREMPPAQRESVIDSAPFRQQFTDTERTALRNVLAVEPYPPINTQGP